MERNMETKLVQVPFDLEMAKRIQNGDCEGKIITRGGMRVRILCFDRIGNESIVALVYDETDNKETCIIYLNDGTIPNWKQTRFDLMLEVPEYLTFKEGDVLVNKSGEYMFILSTNGKCKTSFYVSCRKGLIEKICDEDDLYAACGNDIKSYNKANDEQINTFIKALKESEEPKAQEYLKRFFGIEEHSNSSKIGKNDFKPFDKVLVRHGNKTWIADLFSNMSSDGMFICVGNIWEHCIPYEGNEHLLGTTENPE